MITAHGRATPLLWKTVVKSEMKGQRSAHEDALLERFREVLPQGVKATILADRGFADQAMYELLKDQLGFDFVVRFRSIAPHQLAGSPRPPALVSGIAIALLTMLGAAGEAIGIDKYLKTNPVRRASGR